MCVRCCEIKDPPQTHAGSVSSTFGQQGRVYVKVRAISNVIYIHMFESTHLRFGGLGGFAGTLGIFHQNRLLRC